MLLLPGTSIDAGIKCVERMRAKLADITFDAIEPGLRVTFSAGLVSYEPGVSGEAAIERADAAMYRAKQAGRNCTVVSV